MGSVSVDFDAQGVLAKLSRLKANTPKETEHSTEDIANELLRLTQFEVPHDTGFLQNTGTVQKQGSDFVTGYNTRYAARLHENPQYHFQKGRKGKFLEDPLVRNLKVFGLRWGENVKINLLGKI